MVHAFLIQTLNARSCEILYYRVYSSYDCHLPGPSVKHFMARDTDTVSFTSNSDTDSMKSYSKYAKLFEMPEHKKEFLQYVANKVSMQYNLKVMHSLVPIHDKETFIKGIFMERQWKQNNGNPAQIPIIWQGVPGLGFALICKKTENYVQAQNVLEIIVNQLEKYLQFVSNPVVPLTLIETVALIVNQYLPAGQILFINSKFLRTLEKQLETDLFAK